MNKKIVLILCLVLVSSLLLIGCADDEAEINAVLDDFGEGMTEWNLDILREVLISEQADMITEDDQDEDLAELFEEFKVKDREIEIDGDQAEVSAIIAINMFGMEEETEDEISLIKEDGDWKISNMNF